MLEQSLISNLFDSNFTFGGSVMVLKIEFEFICTENILC
jgi:hypothetical protein